jgi:hypothetical protein
MLRWLLQCMDAEDVLTLSAAMSAADAGCDRVLTYIRQACQGNWDCADTACTTAIAHGDLQRAKWLLRRSASWRSQPAVNVSAGADHETLHPAQLQLLIEFAALAGQVPMIEQLLAEGGTKASRTCAIAAAAGQASTLLWLQQQQFPWYTPTVLHCAAASNSVAVLQLVVNDDVVQQPEVMQALLSTAVQYDKRAAAQWLREIGAEWPATASLTEANSTTEWVEQSRRTELKQLIIMRARQQFAASSAGESKLHCYTAMMCPIVKQFVA